MNFQFDVISEKYIKFLQTKKGKKLKITAFLFIVLAIFTFQLFFNVLSLMRSDDYNYSFNLHTGNHLDSVADLIPSIISHNQTTNGRSVNHIIAQFFLMLNNNGLGIVFDIANSLIYIVLITLIYYHSKGTFKNFKLWWFGAIHLCLWLFIPDYAGCFYWLTGSCNYNWSIVIALLFLIPFTHFSNISATKKTNIFMQIIFALLYIPAGIIAGNTNENTAVALVVMIILFGVKFIIEKKKLHIWMFTGLIGVFVGFGAILLSPGQQTRAEQSGGLGGIATWIKNAVFITIDVFEYLAVPLLLLFCALILVFTTNKNLEFKNFNNFFIYLIGSGSAIYCMMVSPQFPERSWTPPVILAIIAFGQLISLIKNDDTIYRRIVCTALAIATICFGTSYVASYFDIKQTVIAYNEREEYIASQIEKGETILLLKPVRGWEKYNIFDPDGDIGSKSEKWPNTAIARYYGVEKVINAESEEGIIYANSKQTDFS